MKCSCSPSLYCVAVLLSKIKIWVDLLVWEISANFNSLLRSGEFITNHTPATCLFFVTMVPANRNLFMFMSQSMHSEFIQVHPRILGCKHWHAAVRLCHWILKSDTCAVEQSLQCFRVLSACIGATA